MTIPDKLRVGGLTYRIEVTNQIELGQNYSGEIDYEKLVIRIRPMADEKMNVDFLHEMFHAIFEFLGYQDHDEKKIDELAHAMHMIINDNPEMWSQKE